MLADHEGAADRLVVRVHAERADVEVAADEDASATAGFGIDRGVEAETAVGRGRAGLVEREDGVRGRRRCHVSPPSSRSMFESSYSASKDIPRCNSTSRDFCRPVASRRSIPPGKAIGSARLSFPAKERSGMTRSSWTTIVMALVVGAVIAGSAAAASAASPPIRRGSTSRRRSSTRPESRSPERATSPEGIAVSGDTFYAGSTATGEVIKGNLKTGDYTRGFVPASPNQPSDVHRGVLGLLLDDHNRLWGAGSYGMACGGGDRPACPGRHHTAAYQLRRPVRVGRDNRRAARPVHALDGGREDDQRHRPSPATPCSCRTRRLRTAARHRGSVQASARGRAARCRPATCPRRLPPRDL